MNEDDRYDQGLATRREVLGDAYVDRALAARTAVNTEFQELVTRYVFGEIWTRPGLPRDTRRLLVITALIAQNREAELKAHMRAALEGGVSLHLVKETLLQSAIYCGVPAANAAFRALAEVLAALPSGGESKSP
jgi:4-carboxymuconolactone decarboxylase